MSTHTSIPTIPAPPASRPDAGPFSFRPVDAGADAALLHAWIATDHARFWGAPDASADEVRAEYRRIAADPHHSALLAEHDGVPAFLLETYDPAHSPLAGRYAWRHGDVGLHLLLPDPDATGGARRSGFSAAALCVAMMRLFDDPAVLRIVVEPDVRNTAVQALNARLGFRPVERIEIPGEPGCPMKTAMLSWCTRADFSSATGRPATTTAHLSPRRWATAQRHVLAKAIAEFTHERLLDPRPTADGGWLLEGPGVRYTFRAERYLLDHWVVDPASLACESTDRSDMDGSGVAPDPQEFVASFGDVLGISTEQLPVYLEELGSTLSGHCFKQLHSTARVEDLAAGTGDAVADFQRLEAAMTEGHPCFVANNGRLGLGTTDYLDHAPETGSRIRLEWLAAHGSRARFSAVAGVDAEDLLGNELDPGTRAAFDARLAAACSATGLDPHDFLYLPVHPWQWGNKLSVAFAGDVASGHLVHLGSSADLYQPQQSIRTFFNRSVPGRHYVKTALSVLNMGFMRGLSARYMEATPAINDWLGSVVSADPELRARRVELLREVAAVGYTHPLLGTAGGESSPHRKMLAALWRESPAERIGDGESLATMASLLHADAAGNPLAAALVRRSGLAATEWLSRYMDAYLVPLVHCLLRYDLVFMPHGENVILVLRNGVPERMLLKDLAEEVAVLGERTALPEAAARIRAEVPEDERPLVIFTDVVDCFLRFLAPLLVREGLLTEDGFWATVADRLLAYRRRHPELAAAFDGLGLFRPEFALSCLNRLQLRNNQQMLDLGEQSAGLIYAGTLPNPLAGRDGKERVDATGAGAACHPAPAQAPSA